jgi:predicted hotdog family 3-hydroxylacyl-ACP dehydratase
LSAKIDIEEVLQYAPHRRPMVWVDEILSYAETTGECLVNVKEDAHYMGHEGLRASCCLEFIAQGYGYVSIAYRLRGNGADKRPLKRAFLAAFKSVEFCPPKRMAKVKAGDNLIVKIENVRAVGPITSFDGKVYHGKDVLCAASMKVYSEK